MEARAFLLTALAWLHPPAAASAASANSRGRLAVATQAGSHAEARTAPAVPQNMLHTSVRDAVRTTVIDGRSISLPARISPVTPAEHTAEPVNLLITADQLPLLATLIHGGWTPRDPQAQAAHPEAGYLLDGRAPDLALERGGARIDERLRLLLWRHPEPGGPLWIGAALKQGGVQPLQPPSQAPRASLEARDRVLAALSFGLSQSREVGASAAGLPRLVWVKLAAPPPGAEELLGDQQPPPSVTAPGGPQPPPLLAHLPPRVRVSADVISRPEPAGNRVALTFDACTTLDRSFYDERVIAALRQGQAKATLFLSDRWAETHLAEVRGLAHDPLFEIGNHSSIHPHMTEVSPERQREELVWTQQILLSLTGRLPRFFRPPYGEVDPEVAEVAAQEGLRTVEFDFPSGDPDKQITKDRLVAWVVTKARPGSIVVMHMNRHGWHTAEALPEILAGLRRKGLLLSTVGELLDSATARP